MLLQWRDTPSTRHGFESPIFVMAQHPPNRRTHTDCELFGGLTSRSSSFHEINDAHSQRPGIRSMHRSSLQRINVLDSLIRTMLGIPIHSRRDAL